MLVDEQDVVLEAGVEMRLETESDDDRVVVAVDVRVDAVEALEKLTDQGRELLGEGDTNARGEHGLVIDVGLDPGHQVFNVFWGGHLGRLLVVLRVLPEVLEPKKKKKIGQRSR